MALLNTVLSVGDVTRLVLEGRLRLHHRAVRSGYVPKRKGSIVKGYKGRFGSGCVVITGIPGDTRRVSYTYYIRDDKEG